MDLAAPGTTLPRRYENPKVPVVSPDNPAVQAVKRTAQKLPLTERAALRGDRAYRFPFLPESQETHHPITPRRKQGNADCHLDVELHACHRQTMDPLTFRRKLPRIPEVIELRVGVNELHVITGATGLIGSHVAELLRSQGERVRALVRPNSDTRFLRMIGVELVPGDLGNERSLQIAFTGAKVVYHCAARVGDWGPWSLYQAAVLDATRNVLSACSKVSVQRILHVSSINVYGHPTLRPDEWLDEDAPVGRNLWWWDHYCRAKIMAEALVRAHPGAWTVVRPSWTFGPRDRNTLPRVLEAVESGRVAMVGPGDNALNIVHAADIADGIVRAASSSRGIGQVYNLASEGVINQREFLAALTSALGVPMVRRRFPYWLAMTGGFLAECVGRALHFQRPPRLTRYAVALISRTTRFRIDRAREHLGWQPRIHPLEGLRQVLAWYREREPLLEEYTAPLSPSTPEARS